MFIKKSVKIFVLVVLVLALSGFTYAFAAENTVPATKAGDGSEVISGYEVTAVKYILNDTTPSNIDSVTFSLDAPATSVSISLVSGGEWYTCTIDSNDDVTCDISTVTPAVTVFSVNNLRVVAAN